MIAEKHITKFRKSLEKSNTSQAAAARLLDIGATHLNQIIQGHRRPSLELLERMVELAQSLKRR